MPEHPNFQNRMRGLRRMLDELYGDLDTELPEVPGSWTTKMAVSDAIDDIDRAIQSCPREAPSDA